MSAIEPLDSATSHPAHRSAAEVTGWLLDGRWFTIDAEGRVTSWSPAAAECFGWQRIDITGESFAESLLAPDARPAGAEAVASAMAGPGAGQAAFTGDVDATTADGRALRAAFALVPIRLSVGYEFNALLQEVATGAGGARSLAELKARHEAVLDLIDSALTGRAAEAAETEEGGRLAGALVVFRAAVADSGPARHDNVVSIADAAGLEEARGQIERSRAELEQARVELRNLAGQLDEARREAQRSRNEADVARQEAGDARDALAVSQRETEETRRHVADERRAADEARAAVEEFRIRSEEAQREADRVRAELREARSTLRSSAEETGSELANARTAAEWARREAAEWKAQAASHAAEVETLRTRLEETQRELGAARGELQGARAEQVQAAAISERRASEAERLRNELEDARTELQAAREAAGSSHLTLVDPDDVVDAEVAADELDAPSEEATRRALEDDLFELHGQPVLDLRSNAVSQYELLIRMVGEDGRLLLPQAFLGPARRAGLAHAIDRWVVRQAIALLARVPGELRLEVNLSPEAIHDDELPELMEQELASTPIDPARLILEVTGQTAIEDVDATRVLAKRIRALGCRFALDDFRSTFGSFRLLKDLPLDYLKLDGELVGSLAESRTSQLIVKALVEVARGTGTETVAVFVSDEDTVALLRQQGVDYAQGYRVGRPAPIAELWPGDAPAALPAGDAAA